MERTLFLVFALTGALVGGALEWADLDVAGFVVLGVSGVCALVWAIALGVHLGIRDALAEADDDARQGATREILRRSREVG
ncbi:MAG: hypothetical protein ACJ72E_02475 [Marmoricola sp.]